MFFKNKMTKKTKKKLIGMIVEPLLKIVIEGKSANLNNMELALFKKIIIIIINNLIF
jgi:hypothetical protein